MNYKEMLKKYLVEELPFLIENKVASKYSDYNSDDYNWSNFVEDALKEIADEL